MNILMGIVSLFFIGGLLYFLLLIFVGIFHSIFKTLFDIIDEWDRYDE